MGRRWQLQEAKARLSEVIRACQQDGPQEITLRGELTAVVMSEKDFRRLSGDKPSFIEWIRQSPLVGLDLDFERDKSPVRDVEL